MNNNCLFQSDKIIILLVTAFLLFSATFVTLYFDQIVNAIAPNTINSQMNNNYFSPFAYPNISNTSNISLNIIPNFYEIDKVTGQSKIDNKFNVTFSGHGIIKNIPFDDIGFALITPTSTDFSRIQGTVHIVDKMNKEKGTYDLFSIGHTNKNGTLNDNGVQFFSTNSTGKMSFINNMVIIVTDVVNQNTGDGKTIGWELK